MDRDLRVDSGGPPARGDADLLSAIAQGDRAAFEQLVARHEAALYRFALGVTGNAAEAEDAVQDGLLAAWRNAGLWRGEAAVRTWLFQIVVNACRRRSRMRAGQPPAHLDADGPAARAVASERSGPEAVASAREVGRALDAALAQLAEDAREVLVLRDVEGLEGAEAAAALGITLAAMKTRLHRARLELKEKVEAILGRAITEELS